MSFAPRDPAEPLIPPQWAQAVVLDSLHCRKCGYNLQGVRADGRCPECGTDIWMSLQHTVDPTASRLPSLRNPRAVGDSLLVLTLCMLAGMLLLLGPSIGGLIDSSIGNSVRFWSTRFPALSWWSALLLVIAGLWAVRKLAPPRGSEPGGTVWDDIWRIALGLVGWLFFSCLWVLFNENSSIGLRQTIALHSGIVVFAILGLAGLRGVLAIIGARSREYRRSQGGRQSVEVIIAAIAAGFIGALLHWASVNGWISRDWTFMSRTIIWVSNFMVLIGLMYLVKNAWWIRTSLRRPPPPLDVVLAPSLPPDTWIPDREE